MAEAITCGGWFESGYEVTVSRVPEPEWPDYREDLTVAPEVRVIFKPEVTPCA